MVLSKGTFFKSESKELEVDLAQDRRRVARKRVGFKDKQGGCSILGVSFFYKMMEHRCSVVDISSQGISIKTPLNLYPEMPLGMVVHLKDIHLLAIGRVIWNSYQESLHRLGIEFLYLPPEHRKYLDELMADWPMINETSSAMKIH